MSHRQKLGRAWAHLVALQHSIQGFLDSDPYREDAKQHARPNNHVLIVVHWKKQRELPSDLPLLVGDAIYNMRSSLDHLARALAHTNVGNKIKEGQSMFPIHKGKGSYMDAGVRACGQMGQPVQDVIEEMQPYHAGHEAGNHPLGILNDLSNIDKHRNLVLSGAVSTESTFALNPASFNVRLVAQRTEVRYGPFDDQTDIARLLVEIIDPNAESYMKVDSNTVIDVSFPESGPAAGRVVIPELERIFLHIRDRVFPPLEQHLR